MGNKAVQPASLASPPFRHAPAGRDGLHQRRLLELAIRRLNFQQISLKVGAPFALRRAGQD
eukprot:968589-Alexandrium_andersonii.AAC.1